MSALNILASADDVINLHQHTPERHPSQQHLDHPLHLPIMCCFHVLTSSNGQCAPRYTIYCSDGAFRLQYSTNYGRSWSNCKQCNPLAISTCTTWSNDDCTFSATTRKGWTRASIPFPPMDNVRFQFVTQAPGDFAIRNVHVTDRCPLRCGGHGVCISGECVCDAGYLLASSGACEPRAGFLPRELREDFEGVMDMSALWLEGTGAVVSATSSGSCGVIASGNKYFFRTMGRRRLITRDIDTTNARFLQFVVTMGNTATGAACSRPTVASEGAFVAYSSDGGLTSTVMAKIQYYFNSPRQITVPLPEGAKRSATRFTFGQTYSSGQDMDVWVSI